MSFGEALDVNQTLKETTGQLKCEEILNEVLPWETFGEELSVLHPAMERQWLAAALHAALWIISASVYPVSELPVPAQKDPAIHLTRPQPPLLS